MCETFNVSKNCVTLHTIIKIMTHRMCYRLSSLLLAITLVLLVGCEGLPEPTEPVTFVKKRSLLTGRASATAFVVDDKAYVLGGRLAHDKAPRDFWMYNPLTDSWTELDSVPFSGRVKAISAVVDGMAYVGLGFNGRVYADSAYLRDFWRYDVQTNTWDSCADFPSRNSNVAVSFVSGKRIFVAFGFFDGFTRDVYAYDTQTDQWTHCDDALANGRAGAVACSNGKRYFAGTGYNTSSMNDWWEFNPDSAMWIQRSSIPNGGRMFASAIAVNERIFLLGGRRFGGTLTTGFLFDDLLEYDVAADKWLLRGRFPQGGRENMISFSIKGQGYFGLGEDINGKICNDFYTWHD